MYTEYDTVELTPARRGRKWLYVLLAALAVILIGFAATLAMLPREEADLPEDIAGQSVQQPPSVETIVLEEETETPPAGAPMDGGKQTTFDPAGPCADDPVFLVAQPNPVQLKTTKGAVTLHNCGTQKISWTATASQPWATLAQANGVVAAGGKHSLGFTVDTKTLPVGPYSFTIKISEPGHTTNVLVKGTKLGGLAAPNPSPTPTIGGFAGNGPSGCALGCITKAWLTPIHGTANVSLEVKTNTQAKIVALVDTEAPKHDIKGNPYFTSPDVHVASADYRKQWVTALKPLEPATKYHIIVAAKDSKGGITYEAGTFTSPKPVTGLAAGEPGGCSANCVNSALLTPVAGTANAEVGVATHVPAKLQVFANGVTVASTLSQYVTEWATTLELEHDKSYEIKLKVTDEQGHTQTHQAGYTTPPNPQGAHQKRVMLTFHKIFVSNDADDTWLNRTGELRFLFEVNGERFFHTDEMKIRSPHTVRLNDNDSKYKLLIDDAPDTLRIRVQAHERDDGDGFGFCLNTTTTVLYDEVSGRDNDSCQEVEWNTAVGEIDLHGTPVDQTDQALPCEIAADFCPVLSAFGDDPHFDVYVTVRLLD